MIAEHLTNIAKSLTSIGEVILMKMEERVEHKKEETEDDKILVYDEMSKSACIMSKENLKCILQKCKDYYERNHILTVKKYWNFLGINDYLKENEVLLWDEDFPFEACIYEKTGSTGIKAHIIKIKYPPHPAPDLFL